MPWKLPERDDQLLALAKGYPYGTPQTSYLYRDGDVLAIEDADFTGRTPVIGHGSNRSPEQIHRKYGHLSGKDSEIPVSLGWLNDYDVVYSAHVTRYGAIASTLQHAPGCRARIAINWLTDAQLDYMHKTEGFYSYGAFRDVELALDHGPKGARLAEAFVYRGDHGCVNLDGAPVGLKAVPAEGRPHKVLDQIEMLTWVRDRHRPGRQLDQYILDSIRRQEERMALLQALAEEALPSDWPHYRDL